MNIDRLFKDQKQNNVIKEQHQIQHNTQSVLYKYYPNGQWKRVKQDTPQNQSKILDNQHIVKKNKDDFIKKFQNDKGSFNLLYDFQSYRIFRKILGQGSYSKVYLGENKKTKKLIAIKEVKKLQQNQIACLMNSESKFIIKMYSFWNNGNYSYIALQLCQSNLREAIIKCSVDQKIDYFQQIVEGMNYLNKKNIIHRDLKFQNILVKDKIIKISDFGFAKPIGSKLSVISQKCGTPYTMAPQIYFYRGQGKPLYSHKCDIYSLGVILHQMLYSKHPFQYCPKKMEKNQRALVKKNFGYLDVLLDRCLQPQVYKRCNWQQFIQIFSLYRMKKSRQDHQLTMMKNKCNNFTQAFRQDRYQRIIKNTQKNNIQKYRKKRFQTPPKNRFNLEDQLINKKQCFKDNPFKQINLNRRQFQKKIKNQKNLDKFNPNFKENQNYFECRIQRERQEDSYFQKQVIKENPLQEQSISMTKVIALVLMLLIIMTLVQTSSQ